MWIRLDYRIVPYNNSLVKVMVRNGKCQKKDASYIVFESQEEIFGEKRLPLTG
jgi:hypothetical protein